MTQNPKVRGEVVTNHPTTKICARPPKFLPVLTAAAFRVVYNEELVFVFAATNTFPPVVVQDMQSKSAFMPFNARRVFCFVAKIPGPQILFSFPTYQSGIRLSY